MKQTFWDWLYNHFGICFSLPFRLVWKTRNEVFGQEARPDEVRRTIGIAFGRNAFIGFIQTKPRAYLIYRTEELLAPADSAETPATIRRARHARISRLED